MTSDRIPATDNEFDRIYGNGVLHHVPVDTCMPELARILKPSGKACFIEPIPYNPIINAYRKIAASVRTGGRSTRSRSKAGRGDSGAISAK